jgi:hypothetical protein
VSEIPARVENGNREPKSRGHYQISARLQRALMLLASGKAKTQHEACKGAGLTPRALQLAMKRPTVQAYMRGAIIESLGISAMRAAKRIDDLLYSDNEMVSFQASRYALATGANIQPSSAPSTQVNIGIGGDLRAGYIIDLSGPHTSSALGGPDHEPIDHQQ